MTQNQNSDTSQEYVKFDIEDGGSFSQDWLDAPEDEQVVQNLPRVIAKIPNFSAKKNATKTGKRRAFMSVVKKSGLPLAFVLGAILGRMFGAPRADFSESEEDRPIAQEVKSVDQPELDSLAPIFETSSISTESSANYDAAASDRSFENDDSLYRDLDDVSFATTYDDATDSRRNNAFAQTTNSLPTPDAPINPFARDFDEIANEEFDRPALDHGAIDALRQGVGAVPGQGVNQSFSNWSDSNAQAANTPPTAPQVATNAYAVATDAPNYGEQAAPTSYGAGQGFGDYQPYPAPASSFNAQYAQRPAETNAPNYNAGYASGYNANASSTSNASDYQSDYADNSKFRGFNTSTTQENLAIQQNYATNADNLNYNRQTNSGTLENAPYNVEARDPANSATEYLARNPEAPLINAPTQNSQPVWGTQTTTNRSLRW